MLGSEALKQWCFALTASADRHRTERASKDDNLTDSQLMLTVTVQEELEAARTEARTLRHTLSQAESLTTSAEDILAADRLSTAGAFAS